MGLRLVRVCDPRDEGGVTFLPAADVVRLTGGRERFSAQRRALDRMGIRYTVAANGEPLVRVDALDGKPLSCAEFREGRGYR